MAEPGITTSVLSDVVLPLALGVIMFGMGMSLTTDDFRRVTRVPRAVAVGLVGQLVVLPLLAAAVAVAFHTLFGLSYALVLGLLILACCPGGATSNLVAYLARADAALSVTLTSITSLASAVLTPFTFFATVWLVSQQGVRVSVDFAEMAKLVLAIVAVPVLVGMWVRSRRPALAQRADRPFRIASVALLALVIAGVILQNRAEFWQLAAISVPAALTLNALALGAGLLLGRLARLATAESRSIAIEVGFQNGTLGIALAVTQLDSPQAAVVPGFYSLVMFVTGGLLAWHWARTTPPADATAARADAAAGARRRYPLW